MEIYLTQLSWLILTFMLTPPQAGLTDYQGVAEFSWSEATTEAAGVQCQGQIQFDLRPQQEKLLLRQSCEPSRGLPAFEEVLVRFDKHQIIGLDSLNQTWSLDHQPQNLQAALSQFLYLDALQPPRKLDPLTSLYGDRYGGWWSRMLSLDAQDQPSALSSSLHFASPAKGLTIFLNGHLQKLDPRTFEIPVGYRQQN